MSALVSAILDTLAVRKAVKEHKMTELDVLTDVLQAIHLPSSVDTCTTNTEYSVLAYAVSTDGMGQQVNRSQ